MKAVTKGAEFEKEVETILQLKGYTVVRNNLINGTQIDLHATKDDPLDNISLVVECADRDKAIGVDLVKEKSSILLSLKGESSLYRLLFVSRKGFTAEAKAFAGSQSKISLVTFTQLEHLLVDLTPYAKSYIYNYEHSQGIFKDAKLISNYVPLSARDTKHTPILSIDEFINSWINNGDNNLMFLLGDYGSGKSSFCRQFIYNLLKGKYVHNSDIRQTPILINLRDYRGKLDLKRVVTETLVNTYGVELSSYSSFERMCGTGNIILVLDGFDEMSDRSDQQTLIDSFNQIYLMAALQTRIILTCRSNFFRSNEDIINLLKRFSISVPDEEKSQLLEISLEDQGKIVYLEKLNDDQIYEFVEKRFGKKSPQMIKVINGIHDLSDLSTRPVLLDMILSTLPELEKSRKRINSAALYTHYTNRWTNRDQWRVTMPLKVRKSFCEILAWVMHSSNVTEISFEVLEKTIALSLSKYSPNTEQFEKFKNDIQTCSFLVRSGPEDEFRFAHKSFIEFFFAQRLVNDLTKGIPIEKPNENEWFPTKKKNEYLIDHAFNNNYLYSNKAMMVDYMRNSMNDKFCSMPSYQVMLEAEYATNWTSHKTLNEYFEAEIRNVFKSKLLSSFSQELQISEEIATFALELLSNVSVDFKKLNEKMNSVQSIDVFCDILRLSKSHEWISDNSKELKAYLLNGDNDNLKIASISAMIGQKDILDIHFVRSIRGKLSEKGWSYTLFELSNKNNVYGNLLAELMENDGLKPIDQAICLFGLSGNYPNDESSKKLGQLVIELMKSEDQIERDLSIKVCYGLPKNERNEIVTKAFITTDSSTFKKALIQVLNDTASTDSWKLFRKLALTESDPEVKKTLKGTEQVLRDISSQKKSRSSWNHVKGYKNIRDTLWAKK